MEFSVGAKSNVPASRMHLAGRMYSRVGCICGSDGCISVGRIYPRVGCSRGSDGPTRRLGGVESNGISVHPLRKKSVGCIMWDFLTWINYLRKTRTVEMARVCPSFVSHLQPHAIARIRWAEFLSIILPRWLCVYYLAWGFFHIIVEPWIGSSIRQWDCMIQNSAYI